MRVTIATGLLDRLAAAAAASDEEVCGLLFGADDRIDRAIAAANVADDPATGFEIDPATLIAAHRAMRLGGPALVGCYHSHPRGPAQPSARDEAGATAGQLWLILARDRSRLFCMGTDGGFVECTMTST